MYIYLYDIKATDNSTKRENDNKPSEKASKHGLRMFPFSEKEVCPHNKIHSKSIKLSVKL